MEADLTPLWVCLWALWCNAPCCSRCAAQACSLCTGCAGVGTLQRLLRAHSKPEPAGAYDTGDSCVSCQVFIAILQLATDNQENEACFQSSLELKE